MNTTRSGLIPVGFLALVLLFGGFVALVRDGYDGRSRALPLREPHISGGVVRVAVATEPAPLDPGDGGAAFRSLTSAKLFVRDERGVWRANAVVPGSDRGQWGSRTVEFRLRPGLSWSDGAPLGFQDLVRTMDQNRVERLEQRGDVVRVELKAFDPEWRTLWSGEKGIQPPREGVSGGPFVPGTRGNDGRMTFTRNPQSWGGEAPLESLELVPVPDVVTQRQLMKKGDLDVAAPMPDTERRRLWSEAGSVSLAEGGVNRVIQLGVDGQAAEQRWLLHRWSTVPFAQSLLVGEVHVGSRTPEGERKKPVGKPVTLWVDEHDPLGMQLGAAFKNSVGGDGVRVDIRNYTGAPPALSGLNGAVVAKSAGPSGLSGSAGPAGPEMVLWRDRPAMVVNSRIGGTQVNVFEDSMLWNAGDWYLRAG